MKYHWPNDRIWFMNKGTTESTSKDSQDNKTNFHSKNEDREAWWDGINVPESYRSHMRGLSPNQVSDS